MFHDVELSLNQWKYIYTSDFLTFLGVYDSLSSFLFYFLWFFKEGRVW